MANDVQVTVTLDAKQAERALKGLEGSTKKFESTAKSSFKSATSAFDVFKGVVSANLVVGGLRAIGNAALGMGRSTIQAAKDLEQIQNQFITLTGSASKADKVIRDLQDFTATTPFQFEGVARAARQLISFGFEAENLQPILRNIGDAAAGSGSSFGELSLIFGQVRAAGKLTGERLLQLQERAIPIGPALAQTLGVAETSIRDLVSKGKVDFDTFAKAFATLNEAGGPFFESTVRQSKTLGGVLSTLSDNFQLVAADIGQQFLPFLKDAAVTLITFIQQNRELIKSIASGAVESLAVAVGFMADQFRGAIVVIKQAGVIFNQTKVFIEDNSIAVKAAAAGLTAFTIAINASAIASKAATIAFAAYNGIIRAYNAVVALARVGTISFGVALKALGIGLVTAAITALVVRFETLEEFLQTSKAFAIALASGFADVAKVVVEFGRTIFEFAIIPIQKFLEAAESVARVFDADLANSLANAREQIATSGQSFDTATAKIDALKASLDAQGVAAIQAAEKSRQASQVVSDSVSTEASAVEAAEARKKEAKGTEAGGSESGEDPEIVAAQARTERLQQQREQDLALEEEQRAVDLENKRLFEEEKDLIDEEFRLKRQENELNDKIARDEFDAESRAKLLENQKAQNDNSLKLAQLRNKSIKDENKKSLADQKAKNTQEINNEKLVTDSKRKEGDIRRQNLQSTLGTISTLTSSNNKALFTAGKGAAIAQASLDGFVAVQKALASAPPPFNIVLAGIVGAATVANVAKISSTQPPAFQNGGIVPGPASTTDNVNALVASGEMILNRRQQTDLFNSINTGQVGGGGGNITVNVESTTGTIPDDVIDNMISSINDRVEFGNNFLVTG